jgi:hypothetical protein
MHAGTRRYPLSVIELPRERSAPYPDEEQLAADSQDAYVEPFVDYFGNPYEDSRPWLWGAPSGAGGLEEGRPARLCILYDGDGGKLEGSMANRRL